MITHSNTHHNIYHDNVIRSITVLFIQVNWYQANRVVASFRAASAKRLKCRSLLCPPLSPVPLSLSRMPLSVSPIPLSPSLPLPCTRHETCNASVYTCIISSIGASIIILNYIASSRNRNWPFQVGRQVLFLFSPLSDRQVVG